MQGGPVFLLDWLDVTLDVPIVTPSMLTKKELR